MFKWQFSETVSTNATSDQIWALWEDAPNWPKWDSEIEWVKLDGSFTQGTRGSMKPSQGPKVAFELSEVTPGKSFSDTAQLPLTKMVFSHEYLPSESQGSAQIRHTVTMTGLLAPLFGRVIGSQIKQHLREAIENLSAQAIEVKASVHRSEHQTTPFET